MDKITISVATDDTKLTISFNKDASIEEWIDTFTTILLTFHPNTIQEAFGEDK